MNNAKDQICWQPVPNWTTAKFVGWGRSRGLYRAQMHGETMFLGSATKTSLAARLRAYCAPNGTWQNHEAGRLIHRHRASIEMQIALLDLPPGQIRRIAEALIEEEEPRWNNLERHREHRSGAKNQNR